MHTNLVTTIDGTRWLRVKDDKEETWLRRQGFPIAEWPDDPSSFFPTPGQIPAADALREHIAAAKNKHNLPRRINS